MAGLDMRFGPYPFLAALALLGCGQDFAPAGVPSDDGADPASEAPVSVETAMPAPIDDPEPGRGLDRPGPDDAPREEGAGEGEIEGEVEGEVEGEGEGEGEVEGEVEGDADPDADPDAEPDAEPDAQPPPEAAPEPPEDPGPAWAPDGLEPNESCAAGAALGSGDQPDLTLQQGNADWYRVTVCAEGDFSARFEFRGLQGRVDEFLRDDRGQDYGGASIQGGTGSTETGMQQGGRTYCLGYELTGEDLHYSLSVQIEGCQGS